MLVPCRAYCAIYSVWQTNIQVYVQSETENGIYSDGDHPWCGRRVYIDFNDKALLSAALAAAMSKQKVNFLYEDNTANKIVQGHTNSKCKIISIFSTL